MPLQRGPVTQEAKLEVTLNEKPYAVLQILKPDAKHLTQVPQLPRLREHVPKSNPTGQRRNSLFFETFGRKIAAASHE